MEKSSFKKILFGLLFFSISCFSNHAIAQKDGPLFDPGERTTREPADRSSADKAAKEHNKPCSEKPANHFNDKHCNGGSGLEKIDCHRGAERKAEKDAAACKAQHAAEKAAAAQRSPSSIDRSNSNSQKEVRDKDHYFTNRVVYEKQQSEKVQQQQVQEARNKQLARLEEEKRVEAAKYAAEERAIRSMENRSSRRD